MKKIVLLAMGLVVSATTLAQEKEKVETTIAADVVSQYVWRGLEAGSVSLQPTLGIGYKGLSLSAWGSVGLTDPACTKPITPTTSSRLTSVTISVWLLSSGLPTLLVMMA